MYKLQLLFVQQRFPETTRTTLAWQSGIILIALAREGFFIRLQAFSAMRTKVNVSLLYLQLERPAFVKQARRE